MKFIKLILSAVLIAAVILTPVSVPNVNTSASAASLNITVSFNSASGIFTLTASSAATASVMPVLYKDGAIEDIMIFKTSVSASGTKINLNGLMPDDADTLKLYVWNSTSDLKPVAKPYTLNLDKLGILNVQSGHLKDINGNTVVLKGVNFGGWLIQETWMCPVFAFNSNVTVNSGTENGWANLDTLSGMESKFGASEAAKLFKAYQDNYITEWDFQNVKNLGFNCVRIPFWYRNFMSDENGTYYTTDDNDNPGFQKLDWAIETAGKYGLYVVLDMHGCPGGQSGDHSTGKIGRNYLYFEDKYQDIMEDLWTKIADRYKFGKTVVSYDIMNEPLNNADTAHGVKSAYAVSPWVAIADDPRIPVYDRMVKAIRKFDPYHNITLEGIWRIYNLPNPSTYGWTNVMYQLHSYDSDEATTTELINSLVNARKNYGVAAYMGEFNPSVYYSGIVTMMKNNSINYTVWNYKVTGAISCYTNWGLYYKTYSAEDLYSICGTDAGNKVAGSWNGYFFSMKDLSNTQIKTAYTNWWTSTYLSTKNFTLNSTLYNLIK